MTSPQQETAPPRVLILDDEESILEVTNLLLTRFGFSVATARDGAEAVAIYKKEMDGGRPFAVVIADLTIPGGMGGREALVKLKEIDPGVKAIVSSGYADERARANLMADGFVDMISKPYQIRDLVEVIRRHISL